MAGVVAGDRGAKPTANQPPPLPTATPEQALQPQLRRGENQTHAAEPIVEQPHPTLQKAGFNGGVQEFNQKGEAVVQAYHQAHGKLPPAGMVLDIVRSPVDPTSYGNLFHPALDNPRTARAAGAVANHAKTDPGEYFIQRQDGIVQPNTWLNRALNRTANTTQPEATYQQLLKKYPMVAQGMLPIPSFDRLEHVMNLVDKPTQVHPLVPLGQSRAPDQAAQQAAQNFEFGKTTGLANLSAKVTTMTQAQLELNKAMGTNLPVTGVMNDTWLQAIGNWQKTTDYVKKTLQYQSQQAGFGGNVDAYAKAWNQRERVRSHGLYGHLLGNLPLPLFGHGGFWHDLASVPGYLKGNSNNPINIGLHSLTRSAGLALGGLGGTVSQLKADTAAATTLAGEIYLPPGLGGGKTFEQAIADARAQLHANPTWMRALSLGHLPVNETGLTKYLDGATNLLGDLILLRKPRFTGERVAPGDFARAYKSDYLNASSRWAYADLAKYGRDGIGRAASRLEGGSGAQALVARTAKLIQRGDMTPEQFTGHLADLYANGHTTIQFPRGETVEPHVISVKYDAVGQYHKYGVPVANLDKLMPNTGEYMYHATDAANFDRITREGLNPGKVRPNEPTGVFFAQDGGGVLSLRPMTKRAGDVVFRVKKGEVPVETTDMFKPGSGFEEYLSRKGIAPQYLEYLGKDQQWHPVSGIGTRGKAVEINGPVLRSLRTGDLPTPGVPGRAWLTTKSHLRDWIDNFDATSAKTGSYTNARSFINSLRSQVAHYVPSNVGYFDEILPERVFNFMLKHKLGDAGLWNKTESDLVRFQGTENVRGIQSIQNKLERLYHEKYTTTPNPNEDPFKAVLSTEAPSVFRFPKGGEPKVDDALGAIEANTKSVNKVLNRIAVLHSRVILSGLNPLTGLGGFSLFWKHAVGDTLRAEAGGGGILTGASADVRQAKREIDALANSNASASRMLGSFRDKMVAGETRWALGRGAANPETFQTSQVFGKSGYMEAAGGYLRRMIDDPALGVYNDRQALTDLILTDKTYRGMWKAAKQKAASGPNPVDLTAEDYAALVAQRYTEVGDALAAKNLTWDDARSVYQADRGFKADTSLGRWVKEHQLDFEVRNGQVQARGGFDDWTGRWVGNVIMRPNKWNRGRFAENQLASTYAELRKAGFTQEEALKTSVDVAGALTKYHMLDFANRLQIEQNLRWLSYYATKHRLYWKWVIGTMVRKPGTAFVINDFRNALNSHGGVTLPFKLFGLNWDIPLERLVWVPGKEYDETSPLALGVFNFIKSGGSLDAAVQGAVGTSGNVITRSDTATILGTKLLRIETGGQAPSYGYAVAGLDKQTADKVTRALNEYQITYFHDHGHYAPEAQAVKLVLASQLGQEYWRANLPLPFVPYTDRTDEQALMHQFLSLIDPKARRDFLTKHPDLSNQFGVYQDPKQNLHLRDMFSKWAKALNAYHAARRDLYARMQKTGVWSTDMEAQRRELNDALNRTRNELLIADAQWAGINTGGLVPNGATVKYGPWGTLVNKDPQFDPTHVLSTLFPKLAQTQIVGDTVGPLQRQMQQELSLLNDPNYVAKSGYTLNEVKTRKRELLQKLEVFKQYPSDALGAIRDTYQTKYVNSYWSNYNNRYNAIQQMPSDQRKVADSQFRAWRDQQDHPVVINGVQFPSPVRMAWAMLDPKTRDQRLSYLASKPLSDLANYELDLLGVHHPPNVSTALAAIEQASAKYREQNGTSVTKDQLLAVAKGIDKQPGYQGFYAYYVNTLAQPRIRQWEMTSAYQDMPQALRVEFNQVIGQPAIQITKDIVKSGSSTYYKGAWRKAMEQQITPWLDEPAQKPLKDYLDKFGPNFLNELVSG